MIPTGPVGTAFLILYITQTLACAGLDWLNLRHLQRHGRTIPPSFQGFVDDTGLSRMVDYTLAKGRLNLWHEGLSEGLFLALILSGFLAGAGNIVTSWEIPVIFQGVVFFLIPGAVLYLAGLPFGLVHTFVIENRFGFNRSTLRLWILDHIKALILSVFLLFLVLAAVLLLMDHSPRWWWLWSFFTVSVFQVLLTAAYPVIIAPLFNRFEPIADADLANAIRSLMAANNIRVKKILQMDAGIRSRHTNAYFTGFGKTKQIVLFDTLLSSHPREEILAVLAHEAGHYRRKHVLKQMLLAEILLLVSFGLSAPVVRSPVLYEAFGFSPAQTYAGLFMMGLIWQKAGFFVQPLVMAVSRHFERQADRFAVRLLGSAQPLIDSLKRLAADNLANLSPHPLYVLFHYSHPPLAERIALLESASDAGSNLSPPLMEDGETGCQRPGGG